MHLVCQLLDVLVVVPLAAELAGGVDVALQALLVDLLPVHLPLVVLPALPSRHAHARVARRGLGKFPLHVPVVAHGGLDVLEVLPAVVVAVAPAAAPGGALSSALFLLRCPKWCPRGPSSASSPSSFPHAVGQEAEVGVRRRKVFGTQPLWTLLPTVSRRRGELRVLLRVLLEPGPLPGPSPVAFVPGTVLALGPWRTPGV
uniref:Secreted protein n=1 Tax=Ixodes ricinus TaxID=34613 RepID=A0A6B0V2B0_IXORI